MGSSQSSQPAPSSQSDIPDTTTTISYHVDSQGKKSSSRVDKEQLSGMALVNYQCRKKKKKYDKCVSEWYTKEFMTGKSMHQSEVCGDLFEAYRECVLKGIKKEIWDKQGLPPPKEGSPLAEIDDEEDS